MFSVSVQNSGGEHTWAIIAWADSITVRFTVSVIPFCVGFMPKCPRRKCHKYRGLLEFSIVPKISPLEFHMLSSCIVSCLPCFRLRTIRRKTLFLLTMVAFTLKSLLRFSSFSGLLCCLNFSFFEHFSMYRERIFSLDLINDLYYVSMIDHLCHSTWPTLPHPKHTTRPPL